MRRAVLCSLLVALFALTGCKSKYIEATLENRSGQTLSLIQVEYPSASFGTQSLDPAVSFHYRFKLLGSGPVKVSWVDAQHLEHKQQGPTLLEGEEGRLGIVFTSASEVKFSTSVTPR